MRKSFIQLHAAIFLAACSGILGNLIELNEVYITWYRMLISAIIMIPILLLSGQKISINKTTLKIAAAGFLLGLHWIFFYGSIIYANVSVGVVCFCLSSFFTALLSPIINKTRLSVSELLLSSLTMAGIVLIFHFDDSFRTGIILGTVSAFFFALFTIINGRINQSHKVETTTTYEMLGGALGIAVLLPVYHLFVPLQKIAPSLTDAGYLFILALGCTVGVYLLLNRAQRKISAFTVSLSFNLEPIYSIIMAVLLFGEDKQLTPSFYLGLLLIMTSLILQMIRVISTQKR